MVEEVSGATSGGRVGAGPRVRVRRGRRAKFARRKGQQVLAVLNSN